MHLVGEGHFVGKTPQVVSSNLQATCLTEVGQPRPRVFLSGVIVIRKHDVQHISGQALQRVVPTVAGGSPANSEAPILVQDDASAVFQCDELAYREALRMRFIGSRGPEIADRAHAYDATWRDGGEAIRADIRSVRVRAPAPLHTAHFRAPERQ